MNMLITCYKIADVLLAGIYYVININNSTSANHL